MADEDTAFALSAEAWWCGITPFLQMPAAWVFEKVFYA
jgi:hypothetical protein